MYIDYSKFLQSLAGAPSALLTTSSPHSSHPLRLPPPLPGEVMQLTLIIAPADTSPVPSAVRVPAELKAEPRLDSTHW